MIVFKLLVVRNHSKITEHHIPIGDDCCDAGTEATEGRNRAETWNKDSVTDGLN